MVLVFMASNFTASLSSDVNAVCLQTVHTGDRFILNYKIIYYYLFLIPHHVTIANQGCMHTSIEGNEKVRLLQRFLFFSSYYEAFPFPAILGYDRDLQT